MSLDYEKRDDEMREQDRAYIEAVYRAYPQLDTRVKPEPKPEPMKEPRRHAPIALDRTQVVALLQHVDTVMAVPPHGKAKLIVAGVARKHLVSVKDVFGPSRYKEHVAARHEAFWEIKAQLLWSLPQIGRFFRRDHTTVLHGIRKHQMLRDREGRRAVDFNYGAS